MAIGNGKMTPPVNRTLTDQVVRQLRTRIITGQLPPGTQLVEHRLAGQLDVSRSTIREALRRLESESLVDTTSHRGSKVACLNLRDAQEICEAYTLLETHAVRKLSLPLDDDVLSELERVVVRMRRLAFPDDVERFIDLDHAFHSAIVEAAGQRRFVQIWRSSSALLGILVALAMRYLTIDGPAVATRHSVVIDALRGTDTDAAVDALTNHYQSLADHLQTLGDSIQAEGKDERVRRFLVLRL